MTVERTPDDDLVPDPDSAGFDAMSMAQLTAVLHGATRALARRAAAPGALAELDPVASGAADAGPDSPSERPFTLPLLNQALEAIARSVATAQMSMAGHTVQVYENPPERHRLLGMPEGKTAFRNATDYLKMSLRIDGSEAHRRARWAAALRPRTTLTGQELPPLLPHLSAAVHDGRLDRQTVDVIVSTLGKAVEMARRVQADPQGVGRLLDDGEERLVDQGECTDPGTVRKVANHWLTWFEAAVDPDGPEPNDAHLPQAQGMFRKGRRNGLHHWLLAVNDEQNEYLLTIANAATNPRRAGLGGRDAEEGAAGSTADGTLSLEPENAPDTTPESTSENPWVDAIHDQFSVEVISESDGTLTALPAEERRTRGQLQLDGLMACLTGGLSMVESDQLSAAGGSRPQIAVTIDFQTLAGTLTSTENAADLRNFASSAAFTGAIHPSTIRTMACHADIVPVVLGSDSEILDVGRARRLFPARMRQAIAARDGGCSAPGCWIPAPWCEVHHIEHWEHGGPTSTDNGTLLCNHHHHAVHAGAWEIDMRSGRPWFIPAPYLDPRRRPQRNRYWRR